ncbi:NAAA-beta domain-containing protein [Mycena indigotica]|uniref:ceramidase n=1 Tax=Mycena indigotica TaxID=2126181 RepID=A0A8H6T056_9AGAR|nr:NAAA-beta domain-containing protein [Mycena indigotica]KAF7309515.1 NAAA-beta domain-containing protein [Mycena indigotica]
MPPTSRSDIKPTESRRLSSPNEPPVYRVDLSLPPEQRYNEICVDYKAQLAGVIPIYQQLLSVTGAPRFLDLLARTLLRRVHSSEESREIRGIARATGVPLHLVVAFNTFLDLFSGCSSGGALVSDAADGQTRAIVHFRGLDWEMEPLRRLLICVDYVRDSQVVARAVTYAGYVGVLTGVRYSLSISLNYRVRIGSPSSTRSHRLHQIALLLGLRPSISSVLRKILLSPSPPPSLTLLAKTLPSTPSTPCYLTFCAPDGILILEKDLVTAKPRTSSTFIAVTNHDEHIEALSPDAWRSMLDKDGRPGVHGNDMLLRDSIERKECVMQVWHQRSQRQRARLTVQDVVGQLETQPVQNESTHFSCVMDPSIQGGGLLWVRVYPEPIEMEHIVVSDMESD